MNGRIEARGMLAARVKSRRQELGWSQEELAKKMGYKSRTSINKIEMGRAVSQKIIIRLAEVLDTSPAWLMGWIDASADDAGKSVDAADISARLLSDDAFFQTVYRLYQMTPQQFEDASKLLEIAFKKSE